MTDKLSGPTALKKRSAKIHDRADEEESYIRHSDWLRLCRLLQRAHASSPQTLAWATLWVGTGIALLASALAGHLTLGTKPELVYGFAGFGGTFLALGYGLWGKSRYEAERQAVAIREVLEEFNVVACECKLPSVEVEVRTSVRIPWPIGRRLLPARVRDDEAPASQERSR